MRTLIAGMLLLVTLVLGGCGAGLALDLSTHDNVIAAAVEARKGVNAFNETVIADTTYRQEQMVQAVGDGVKKLAEEGSIDPEQAKLLAESVTASLRVHLANYAEQERRRAHLFEVTIDNLNYIIQISEQGKKFSIYRADIGQQWKDYLQSSARRAIGTVE